MDFTLSCSVVDGESLLAMCIIYHLVRQSSPRGQGL